MTNPDELYRILSDAKRYNQPVAKALRRDVGYLLGETIIFPEEPVEENIESMKADLEQQGQRVIESQLQDLMKLRYDLN